LRPRRTCASIHARCGSQAERAGSACGFGDASLAKPGGRGGGISAVSPDEPVAMGEFAGPPTAGANSACASLRIVLRSTPVLRQISRCEIPFFNSVSTVLF
jgi:hypothetical protein